MSTSKKSVKIVLKLIRQILQLSRTITKKLMSFLLRGLLVFGRRSRLSRAGFVLPTVVMVMLVVVLLTSAVVFRSFDRSRNISNYRVNQEVLNAALPAIDRAKAKIEALFADPNLPRGTPSDIPIDQVLNPDGPDKYSLPDETRLTLRYDLRGGTPGANRDDDPNLSIQDEAITKNAWRFAVDTDNNGLKDSFTLYSILFRTPSTGPDGNSTRERVPLESRALPMANGESSPNCPEASGTSASLVGASGWYKTGSLLKRSLFIYVTTVPITDKDALGLDDPGTFENYTGNKGFSALEYQQDRAQVPLSNNAVLYEDDVDISSGGNFTLNGRIFTNSNLFVTAINNATVTLRQVSSRKSCFYEPENSKIVVGGNLAYGRVTGETNSAGVNVDLFQATRQPGDPITDQTVTTENQSVTQTPPEIAYNSEAYEARIAKLVDSAMGLSPDPSEVTQGIRDRFRPVDISTLDPSVLDAARKLELDTYFRNRTRRVPFTEVAFGATDPELSGAEPEGSGETLSPPQNWMYPFEPSDGKTESGFGELTLNISGNKLLPAATRFDTQEDDEKERFIGDRVLIGNNLPARWLQGNNWVGEDAEQPIQGTVWDNPDQGPRTRKTRVEVLSDLGDISRDGFWERKAAELPENSLDGIGGVRIVTGAGIYLPDDNNIATTSKVVWPDTMPVIPSEVAIDPNDPLKITWLTDFPKDETNLKRPFLKMRATAVYAYNHEQGKKPIACVSSFYDPTNAQTVENRIDTDGSPISTPPGVNSVNGLTYSPPTTTESAVLDYLNYEADLVYPNGRPVNALLKTALGRAENARSLAEQAAIDATICGLQIYGKTVRTGPDGTWGDIGDPTTTPTAGYQLPHQTIREIAFLDGRQIKAITGQLDDEDSDPATPETTKYTLSNDYDLALEQRQPLEIRVTQLNLQNLRTSTAGELITSTGVTGPQENMLPLSGIIYATRDDALTDASDAAPTDIAAVDTNPKIAASDFKLDFKRRPNGIMLINGGRLERTHTFVAQEKGLILASNLPVYVKAEPPTGASLGGFNSHQNLSGQAQEEFTDTTANFYARAVANPLFACRSGDPRLPDCTASDTWRPATILSDAVTLLSSTFREGNRAEGDYDLRNNQIDTIADVDGDTTVELKAASEIEQARLKNGFWNNDFVTNGLSSGGIEFDFNGNGDPSDDDKPKDADYINTTASTTYVGSSYFNNFVTPVQRRVRFPEYVMEICRKLPVSECKPADWVVGYDFDNDGLLSPTERDIKSSELATEFAANSLANPFDTLNAIDPALLGAGTTTRPAMQIEDRRYARRVVFLRWTTALAVEPAGFVNDRVEGALVLETDGTRWSPVPLGIAGNDTTENDTQLRYYPYSRTLTINGIDYLRYSGSSNARRPRLRANTLWYRGQNGTDKNYGYLYPLDYVNGSDTNSDSIVDSPALGTTIPPTPDEQPLLVPVLQLQVTQTPSSFPSSLPNFPGTPTVGSTRWLQQADGTTIFNLLMATGDSPSRPSSGGDQGEFNGGLANLPRFLENWIENPSPPVVRFVSKISGSLIQIKRSSYATAPFQQVPISFTPPYSSSITLAPGGPFGYPQIYNTGNSAGRTPAYEAPGREWGFDVGILSQLPDLFSKQFTLPPTEKPNEFFREVGRDDAWVQTLLCARTADNNSIAINDAQRPTSSFCRVHSGG
jgi:type II secretory pathway pseudopilin PulG